MPALHSYQHILETSRRVNWDLSAVVSESARLDFSRPFLPEAFARTRPLEFLSAAERVKLNQIRARGYLALFEMVEAVVVSFVSAQAGTDSPEEPFRCPALEHFAGEEEKHRALFRAVLREFDARFGTPCGFLGPAEEICRTVLSHDGLALAVLILGLEWMSQGHYLESVKDDQDLDAQFKSLLRYHWIEEAQHARLDGLLLQAMARRSSPEKIAAAIEEFFAIGSFLDSGLKHQAALDLESLERAAARTLSPQERLRFLEVQHGALRYTFLGSTMLNRNFLAVLASISREAAQRVEQAGRSLS